jgi:hypothetical protein
MRMKYKPIRVKKTDPIGPTCKKKIYYSFDEAKESIEYLQETKWIKDLSAYKCTICGFWHLTSK